MAKGKALTYEEFIALAKENYTKGGDDAVECWERYQFDEYVKMFGAVTKTKALRMFRQWRELDDHRGNKDRCREKPPCPDPFKNSRHCSK